MNRAMIETRLKELAELRTQQARRLEAARQEERDALASLQRIEGAAQDCAFWLTRQDEFEREIAEANGAVAAALAEQN